MSKRLTTEEFIKRARKVHGDKYDYSGTVYVTMRTKVSITCVSHGVFWQRPDIHLAGHKCPLCGNMTRGSVPDSKENFVRKARRIHGSKYDYSCTEYINSSQRVAIRCIVHDHTFYQTPQVHVKGSGCKKCRRDKLRAERAITTAQFIERSIEIHKDKYDYSKVEYINSATKVSIFCKKHAKLFRQVAGYHMTGSNCPDCAVELAKLKTTDTKDMFLDKATKVFGDKFDYSNVEYIGSKLKVEIRCKEHGIVFRQTPMSHLHGNVGCKKCSNVFSTAEMELGDFLAGISPVVRNNRELLGGKEIDILLPEKGIGVEFNGSVWHSERYSKNPKWHMLEKQKMCEQLGIRLIHVADFEDKTVVRKTLAHILGADQETHYARNCEVIVMAASDSVVNDFLNRNHLQGAINSGTAYCLTIRGSVVAVMVFSKCSSERGCKDSGRYELRRFSSCCRVVGGAGKLFSRFLRTTAECTSVVSYSDNRWFTGGMYKKLGFTQTKLLTPDYKYVKDKVVMPKIKFKRSELARRQDIKFNPKETEVQNSNRNGWYRIWDCGKKKWEYKV